jgi:hypothetical protein
MWQNEMGQVTAGKFPKKEELKAKCIEEKGTLS